MNTHAYVRPSGDMVIVNYECQQSSKGTDIEIENIVDVDGRFVELPPAEVEAAEEQIRQELAPYV